MKPLWGQVRGHVVLRLYVRYYAPAALLRFQHSDTHTHTHTNTHTYKSNSSINSVLCYALNLFTKNCE